MLCHYLSISLLVVFAVFWAKSFIKKCSFFKMSFLNSIEDVLFCQVLHFENFLQSCLNKAFVKTYMEKLEMYFKV